MTRLVRTNTVALFLSTEYLILGGLMQLVSLNLGVSLFNIGADRPWNTFLFFMVLSPIVIAVASLFGKEIDRTPAPDKARLETTNSYVSVEVRRLPLRVLAAAIGVVLIGSIGAGMFVGLGIFGYLGWARTRLWERTHDSIVVQQVKHGATQGEYFIKNSPC